MKLAHRYKLKPTAQQRVTLRTWLELCRRQYNYRLGEGLRWWEATRTPVNACRLTCSIVPVEEIYKDIPEYRVQVRDGRKKDKDGKPVTKKGDTHPNIVCGYVEWQSVQLADLKNTKKKFPEYKQLHSQVLQDVVNRVDYAFSRYTTPDKNGKRSGRPKFKGKVYYKSFTYSQLTNAHLIKDEKGRDLVDLPGIGLVSLVLHRPIPTGFKVKTATVRCEADSWYITFSLEDNTVPVKEDEAIQPTWSNSVGIDLGLEDFLVTSEGDFVDVPQFLRKAASRLAKLQRNREKHFHGSYPRRRLNQKIAKLHAYIARCRMQFHFEIAYKILDKTRIIFVEYLSLKNLIRRNKPKTDSEGNYVANGQSARAGLNKSFVDAAHGQFVSILKWVAWKLGKRVIEVDPWGTSQHCHNCLNKTPKALSDRWHDCSNCGVSMQRDHNSAILIKKVGLGVASLKNALKGKKPTP
ncbi:RNA-guided endonuclease InsQ/TnpB family protein [Microseira sp. BLCC-F43]|uniref:RNA-guided endonuclease InsQ/TnpB family protein n=1 Tax=Microseira sp. BLCC-F43 TaxID=3153602 RepID=UPI0035BB6221